jgi:hypothetical protein
MEIGNEEGYNLHSLKTDGFNEAVENLSECVSTEPGSLHCAGVAVHAEFPVAADGFQGG